MSTSLFIGVAVGWTLMSFLAALLIGRFFRGALGSDLDAAIRVHGQVVDYTGEKPSPVHNGAGDGGMLMPAAESVGKRAAG